VKYSTSHNFKCINSTPYLTLVADLVFKQLFPTMASYNPDRYMRQSLDTQQTMSGRQSWENNDSLSYNFTSAGRLTEKQLEELLKKGRDAKTLRDRNGEEYTLPKIEKHSDAEVEEQIAKRRETRANKKLALQEKSQQNKEQIVHQNQKALDAVMQQQESERALYDKVLKGYQQSKTHMPAKVIHKHNRKMDKLRAKEKEYLKLIENPEYKATPKAKPGTSRIRRQKFEKLSLNEKQIDDLDEIVRIHRENVVEALNKVNQTHQNYLQELHDLFVKFAMDKQNFYEGLSKPETEEQVRALDRMITTARKHSISEEERPVSQVDWPPAVFKDFQKIMNDFREDIQTKTAAERKKAFSDRTLEIRKYLQEKKIEDTAKPKRSKVIGG
jgi:hypothetical protein